MTHALITGGTGFIGLQLGLALARRGWHVDLLDNFSRHSRNSHLTETQEVKSIRTIETDLLSVDIDKIGNHYSHIFHFAAMLGVQNVIDHPYDVLHKNVALTVSAIELARRQRDLQRFVFASTSEVYAGTLENFEMAIPTPEDTPKSLSDISKPRTSYMQSKLYGESLCLHSGLPITIVRPHNVYGPRMGMAHAIPQLLQRGHNAADGSAIDLYSPSHTRTFCFIDDAVEMIVRLALLQDSNGEAYNIGVQSPEISIAELMDIIIATLGKRLVVKGMSDTQGSPRRRAPDMSKCLEITNYNPAVGLDEGISQTYHWYRRNMFGETNAIDD